MPQKITRISPDGKRDEGPSGLQMAKNAAAALGRVVVSKHRFAAREIVESRMEICRACDYWREKARGGLGKCTHVKCGCTKLKHALATESCPIGKWGRVDKFG